MGHWDDLAKEDMSGSGNGVYFVPGNYPLLKVKECKFKEASETYKNSDVFIALLEVVDSKVDARAPGTVIEYIVKKKKKDGSPNTFYFKNIKKLLMAVFEVTDPAEINKEVMDLVLLKGAAVGKHVSAVATNITLENGNPFTSIDFAPAQAEAA